jgi:phosphatidylserine decarboxylase
MNRPIQQGKSLNSGSKAGQTELFALLKFFYKNRFGRSLRRVVNTGWLNNVCGWYQNLYISRYKIKSFVKKHGINTEEIEKPINQYRSFNEFFIRKLNPQARPIDNNPNVIISPVDGSLLVVPDISNDIEFFVKNKKFNLEKFLRNNVLAKKYSAGTLFVFRLAPQDYHRFHFPTLCIPSKYHVIKGIYESVNPLVYLHGVQPLTENERHLTILQTERFDKILMVTVGALLVGRIVETYVPNQLNEKGKEAGYFEFGGSTLVLLFKQNVIKAQKHIVKNSHKGIETAVKMGQAITG